MFKDEAIENLSQRMARVADDLSIYAIEIIELLERWHESNREQLVEAGKRIEVLNIGNRAQAIYKTLVLAIKENYKIDQKFEDDLLEIVLDCYIIIEDTLLVLDKEELEKESPETLLVRMNNKKRLLERARQELYSVADIFA